MLEFSGNTGRLDHIAFLRKHGLGICRTAADYRPPRDGIPWILDNGAFSAYRQKKPFDGDRFLHVLERVPRDNPPLFVVCPDIVAGGNESLDFSLEWMAKLKAAGHDWLPYYVAVQDDMSAIRVADYLLDDTFAGVFVGGTPAWKHSTMAMWTSLAHHFGKKCHVGRIGTPRFLAYARSVGADSVDSTSWAQNDTHHYVLAGRQQRTLLEVPHG